MLDLGGLNQYWERNDETGQGFNRRPAISNIEVNIYTTQEMDDLLIEMLENLFEIQPGSFPPYITSVRDVIESYHCYRMWRRTSDTRAIEIDVSEKYTDVINRWSQVQQGKSKKPSLPTKQLYAQIELLIAPFEGYTNVM